MIIPIKYETKNILEYKKQFRIGKIKEISN